MDTYFKPLGLGNVLHWGTDLRSTPKDGLSQYDALARLHITSLLYGLYELIWRFE